MKTTTSPKARIAAITFSLLVVFTKVNAQYLFQNQVKIGSGIEQYISGDSHGTLYCAYLNINKGKNNIYMGPVMQKRSLQVQGAKLGYSRILTGGSGFSLDRDGKREDERLQLNAFGYLQYLKDMSLSYGATIIEERTNRKSDFDWSKLKLSTAEVCVGFELHIKINKNISWKNYVGTSVYYHLNYKEGMYHERLLPVLTVGTGISIKHF